MGLALLIVLTASPVSADPCGMVPPIDIAGTTPVERIGIQKTYVFFRDGLETFVIRPGYRGRVEDFGMLIPFPTPPAIRKVPDDIFAHVAAAVDPPEVVVNLFPTPTRFARSRRRASDKTLEYFAKSEVRVLRQEAVGMYEVAVLEAGSAAALSKWMDRNGYTYPDGMDDVCEDYVARRWCFVAVKTRVGSKAAVDPRPGLREVDPALPEGAVFDGHVQAMGFRFRSEKLVVPMRLSAFNAGELRNVIYVLSDTPCKVDSMPERFVVRQLPGEELFENLTRPVPLRIMGGSLDDIPASRRLTLPAERDPAKFNGLALELFASDLLSARTERLAHEFEEREKELLRISERLGLRGKEIDSVHAGALAEVRRETLRGELEAIKTMTLTVIDGDFPRDVLARENLTFSSYTMETEKNGPETYDAREFGPAPKRPGTRITKEALVAPLVWLLMVLGAGLSAFAVRRRGVRRGSAFVALLATGLLAVSAARPALAPKQADGVVDRLIDRLDDPARAESAVAALVALGDEAVDPLFGEAVEGPRLARRGWAIIGLGEIADASVDEKLRALHTGESQPEIVRHWAAAARLSRSRPPGEFIALARELVPTMPALSRPVRQRLPAVLASGAPVSVAHLIELRVTASELQAAVDPIVISSFGPAELVEAMTSAGNQAVRQTAAGYLATLGAQQRDEVASAVIAAYRFGVEAKQTPWHGGALFVPRLAWTTPQAKALCGSLLKWFVFCERRGLADQKKQLHNNLRSLQLARAAGYTSPGWREVGIEKWLRIWRVHFGTNEVRAMLEEQGVADDPRFKGAFEG